MFIFLFPGEVLSPEGKYLKTTITLVFSFSVLKDIDISQSPEILSKCHCLEQLHASFRNFSSLHNKLLIFYGEQHLDKIYRLKKISLYYQIKNYHLGSHTCQLLNSYTKTCNVKCSKTSRVERHFEKSCSTINFLFGKNFMSKHTNKGMRMSP